MSRSDRNSIFLEEARVLAIRAFPGRQYLLRLDAPRCAGRATPGTFVHLQCATSLPMRRPLSIMRADAAAGWIEVLFKVVGTGTAALAGARSDDRLSMLGPIGNGFRTDANRTRPLLIGGGVGIPPVQFLAEHLAADRSVSWQPVAFFGSEVPFPFRPGRSTPDLHGLDHRIDACEPTLEALGVPSRLASLAGFAGCYRGHVTALAGEWLAALHENDRREVMIFACGPPAMLGAAARLARDFGLPAQVCVEEHMACGVGGCAGCAIEVRTAAGPAMQRVCVDGPVFDAAAVFS